MPKLIEEHETIEKIFTSWGDALGTFRPAYRGHVYRMVNFCVALLDKNGVDIDAYGGEEAVTERLAVAGSFHDVGIFLDNTVDYLQPSSDRAAKWIEETGHADWTDEVRLMVELHHKITQYRGEHAGFVEAFRKADLVDVMLGNLRFGIPASFVREVKTAFPNAGFHSGLAKTLVPYMLRHPLRPLPMYRL